jgi:trk system potassium uptake protein TrkH
MSMRHSSIVQGLGLVMQVPGVMALLSLPISLLARESIAIWVFLGTAILAIGSGQFLMRLARDAQEADIGATISIAALGWGIVAVIGALPFFMLGIWSEMLVRGNETVTVFSNPLNALFESISGFTSTGLSVVTQPEELPYSLQWWRSFSEWIGGVGVIVLTLAVVQSTGGMFRLYYSEARDEKLAPSVTATVRNIAAIYAGYTLLAILLLRASGMPWWPALNHGMTGIATGGFSIHHDSMASYSRLIQMMMVLVMICGAISFAVHQQVLLRRNISALWRDGQQWVLGMFLLVGTLLLALEQSWYSEEWTFLDPLFQWVSALTTCGLSTTNVLVWSPSAQLLLILGMFSGSAAGSTSGGIKIRRLLILFQGVRWRLQQLSLSPHQLMRYTLEGEVISEEQAFSKVESAAVLLALWLATLILAIVVLLHVALPGSTIEAIIFEVVSATSNVGLSLGVTSAELHWLGKITLMFCMWMGRLEIIPVLFFLPSLINSWRNG